jgi:hypothetical protein
MHDVQYYAIVWIDTLFKLYDYREDDPTPMHPRETKLWVIQIYT